MEIIISILKENLIVILVGIFFMTVGIAIPKFKMYWLIAGLNGRPKKEIEKYNLRYIEKYFGLFMLALGFVTILNPLCWTILDNTNNIEPTVVISIVCTVVLMFIFGFINKNKILRE